MPQSLSSIASIESPQSVGSGLSWVEFPDRALFSEAKDAILTGPLPSSPWKAGEARPFSALKAGYGTVASLGYILSFVGASCMVRAFNNAGMPAGAEVSQAMMGLIALAQTPLGVMVAEMAGRPLNMKSAALSAKVAALSGRGFIESVKSSSSWLAAKALGGVGLTQTGVRLQAFSDRCETLGKAFKDQSVKKSLDAPELLTEIGSWRAAREFMDKGMAGSAAKLWLSRPFNPDWEVPCPFLSGRGERSFKEALKGAASARLMSDQAAYVEQTISVMEAVSDRLHLLESTPSVKSEGSAPKPRKKSL